MASLFTRIIQGEIPCYKIAEDDYCMAFLDIFPLKEGHTLVVPKKEVDHWIDLDAETQTHLILFAQRIGKAIQSVTGAARIGLVIAGFEIPHTHIHLIPVNSMNEMNFSNPKTQLTEERFKELASLISSRLEA
jgi:histidine triad (HIT) family protein